MCQECMGIECNCECRNEQHRYSPMRIFLFCVACDHVINEKEALK